MSIQEKNHMGKSNKNLLFLALMIVISCATQVLALMKSSMVAGLFGTSEEIDAYNFANSIAAFIFGFVSAGISTIIIPSYVKKKNNEDINSFITLIYSILFLVTVTCLVFRIPIISIITHRDKGFISIAANSLIILMLSTYLTSFANITTAFFQCINKYNTPKIINLISQLIVIGILIYVDEISIYQYAMIIALGVAFNFVFDTLIAVKYGWRIKLNFHFNNLETKKYVKMFLPIVFSTGIYRLSLMIDSTIAARLETGKITVLGYSNQIASMVNSVIVGNMLVYLYPKIVSRINKENNQRFFWEQSAFFHSVVCLIIAGFACVGKDGIQVLFEHGKFNSDATKAVFYGALIYIIGQQTNIIRDLIYRYFYAKGNTKTAAGNSLVVGITNISVSLILVYFIGFYGIILGTIIASFVSLITIMYRFHKLIGYEVSIIKILSSYFMNILISVVTIFAVMFTRHILILQIPILRILIFGTETVLIYFLLTILINRKVLYAAKSI
ncbi:MAG: oligosaccharide flippase family protein [Clostridia bacterium]|nr:oligosaccharide flippase family protein [Clostridia bacterium]